MLFTGLGRSVLGKTVPSVSSTALGLRSRAVLETSGNKRSIGYLTNWLVNIHSLARRFVYSFQNNFMAQMKFPRSGN